MTSRSQALRTILDSLVPLGRFDCPLERCVGLTVAETIVASESLPQVDRSAMDGFAVRSHDCVDATEDYPVRLKIAGVIHPSTDRLPSVKGGKAVRIMTGGAMPPGADAVVLQEHAIIGENTITITKKVLPNQYVSPRGKDIEQGDVIAKRGTTIDPVLLSIMAEQRMATVPVYQKPTVSILAIGNELLDFREKRSGHKIVAGNLYLLSALIESIGAKVIFARITKNNKTAIASDFQDALQADLVITAGGTGKGPADLTRVALEDGGVNLRWAGLAMAPGKGTMFGLHGNTPVFALPGTPAAVLTVSHVLIGPAIRKLMGCAERPATPITAILEQEIRKKPGMERLVPGFVQENKGHLGVRPLVGLEQTGFLPTAKANGWIILPSLCSHIQQGEPVDVLCYENLCLCRPAVPVEPQKKRPTIPCISIVGLSGMGKTTLLEKLIPELGRRGYAVGTIKHDVHGFDIDHEGKDSWRHKRAGASTVVIASPAKVASVRDVAEEQPLQELVEQYFQDVDIVLTEGYKREPVPKVEVFRSKDQGEPICRKDENLVALYSDRAVDLGVPRFLLEDIKGLADFLVRTFLKV